MTHSLPAAHLRYRLRNPWLLTVLTPLLALSACVLRPDSGRWSGELQVHDTRWRQRYSCHVELEIHHTRELVALSRVELSCAERSLRWAGPVLRRAGTRLYQGDRELGQVYADGSVRIVLPEPGREFGYPYAAEKLELRWTLWGDSLQLSMIEERGREPRWMEARLQKMP